MPGGRLTPQDRRDIAAGLAEALGYAEIARRVRRPTSTVSREVSRNGGRSAYEASRANETAIQRAARGPATPQRAERSSELGGDPQGLDNQAVRDFGLRFSEVMIEAGFPRTMARVLISLYTSTTGSLTAAELAQRLHVSPATISKAVGMLERLEFLRRERDQPHRRERYIIDEYVWDRVWRRQTRWAADWGALVREGARVLDHTPAGTRLDRLSQFLLFHHQEMLAATERWRQLTGRDQPYSPTGPSSTGK